MSNEWRIPYDEFATHLDEIIERIVRTRETVVVEAGEDVLITIQSTDDGQFMTDRGSTKTREDLDAFLASAGSWKDVDTDQLIENIYAGRKSSRPPVDL